MQKEIKEAIDKKAWEFYWRRQPKGTFLAENSRPDMVIGYVEAMRKVFEKMEFKQEIEFLKETILGESTRAENRHFEKKHKKKKHPAAKCKKAKCFVCHPSKVSGLPTIQEQKENLRSKK